MPCAIASQMEAKKPYNPSECKEGEPCPGDPAFRVGGKEGDFKNNIKTNNKYLDLLITNSGLKCKRCVPTGYKCKLHLRRDSNNNIVPDQPGTDGEMVDSYFFTDDKTLETGLLPRMIDSVGRVVTNINIDNVLNVKKKNAICRPYIVSINTDEDGQKIPVWCNITDETIKDADFDINSFKNADSIMLALNVRNNQAYGQHGLKDVAGHLNVAGIQENGGGNFNPPNSYANGNYFQDNTFGGKIKFVHETRSNYMIRWINESNKGTIDWHDINNWPGDAWYITRHIVVERKQTFLAVKNIYKTQIIAYNSTENDDDILGKIPSKNGWTEPAGANQGINPPSSTISVTKDLSMRENFSNMKNNKLNPQNLTLDDDIPMKVYYGLLGVGGIYLLYQLSKKYGNKLNLDQ